MKKTMHRSSGREDDTTELLPKEGGARHLNLDVVMLDELK